MTCYGHWELDLDLGDGDTVELCARYSGHGDEVLRNCDFCPWNRDEADDVLNYGMGVNHHDLTMAEGMEWK